MAGQANKNNYRGYLLILLLLLFLYYTAMEKNSEVNSKEINNFPVYIRIEGDIDNPGVFHFNNKNDLLTLLKEKLSDHSIDISWLLNNEPQWDSGITLKIDKEGSLYHHEKMDIPAYHKVTLGIPININRESVEGLTAIPGIGESLALTIEKEREKRNGFSDINELRGLPGIGEKKFIKIKPYVKL